MPGDMFADMVARFGADTSGFDRGQKAVMDALKKSGMLASQVGGQFDAAEKRKTASASSGASARIGIALKESQETISAFQKAEASRQAHISSMEQTAQRIRSIGATSANQRSSQLRQQAQEEAAAATQRISTIREVANADIAAANEEKAARNAALAEQNTAMKAFAAEQEAAYAGMRAKAEESAAAQSAALKGIGTIGLNAAAGITGLGLVAAKMSSDFEQSLLRLRNNTLLSDQQFQQMKQTILTLGAESGASLDQLAQGARHIADYGFQGANATNILTQSMKAAVATGSEVGQTGQLIARILNEYGLSAESAKDVTNELWLAVAKSDSNFKQMVESGGQAFAMAAKMGVSFQTTAAVMSVFAKNGITVAQSGTQMRNMLNSLTTPAKTVQTYLEAIHKKTMIDLSKDFTLAGIKGDGMAKTFADIQEAARRMGVPVADMAVHLFPGLRAKIGALIGTSDEGLIGLRNLLQQMPEAAKQNPIDARYLAQIGSAAQQWKILVNAMVENFLPAGKKVTDLLIRDMPIFKGFIDLLARLLDFFTRLPGPMQQIVFGLGALRLAGLSLGTAFGATGLTGVLIRLVKELRGVPEAAAEAGTALEGLSAAGSQGGLLALLSKIPVAGQIAAAVGGAALGVGALSIRQSNTQIAANDRPLLSGTIQGLRRAVADTRGTAEYGLPAGIRMMRAGLNPSETELASNAAQKMFGKSSLIDLTGPEIDQLAGKFHAELQHLTTEIANAATGIARFHLSPELFSKFAQLSGPMQALIGGRITQGRGNAGFSKGTHLSGDALDISTRGLTKSQIDDILTALYGSGMRAAYRAPGSLGRGSIAHIHAAGPGGTSNYGRLPPHPQLLEAGALPPAGGGGVDWPSLLAKAQKKQDFTTALASAQIAAMPDGEQKEIKEVMEQFRQKRLDAMKNFSASQANQIIKDLNTAQTQAIAGVRKQYADEDQAKALRDWKNVQQVAAQAAEALKTAKGTLTSLYGDVRQGQIGARTGNAGLTSAYNLDIQRLVQQRSDTIAGLPAALSPADRSHAVSRLYDIFGAAKGNRLTQYNKDLGTFNAQYGYGGTQDQDFFSGLVGKLSGGLSQGLGNLPGGQSLSAMQGQLAELQKLRAALPAFATTAQQTMDDTIASLNKSINDQQLEEMKAGFKAFDDKQQTAFDLIQKINDDMLKQLKDRQDFIAEWADRVRAASGDRGDNRRTRLQNEVKKGLGFPTMAYNDLPADMKSQADAMVNAMISGQQRGKLRDFWRQTADDAQRSFKGAATGFFEGILSGQSNFKTSLKNLFGDVRLIAARALSNVLVENLEGAFKSLFGGGQDKKNVGDALDAQAKGISRKGSGFQSSLGGIINVLNQGSGLLAGAVEGLIAALSGSGKKKKHSFLGGLIGGALGFLTGGPAGAIAGALGGYGNGVGGALEGATINFGLGSLGGIGNGTPPIAPARPHVSSFAKASGLAPAMAMTSGGPSTVNITHIGDVHTNNQAEVERMYANISRQFRASSKRG